MSTTRTNADAMDRVREICERHGDTEIAKSKSMVTEEIELNHAMAEYGIDVVETDLGEWIVQKARRAAEPHRRTGAAYGAGGGRGAAQPGR